MIALENLVPELEDFDEFAIAFQADFFHCSVHESLLRDLNKNRVFGFEASENHHSLTRDDARMRVVQIRGLPSNQVCYLHSRSTEAEQFVCVAGLV